jgi:hypothetical protein
MEKMPGSRCTNLFCLRQSHPDIGEQGSTRGVQGARCRDKDARLAQKNSAVTWRRRRVHVGQILLALDIGKRGSTRDRYSDRAARVNRETGAMRWRRRRVRVGQTSLTVASHPDIRKRGSTRVDSLDKARSWSYHPARTLVLFTRVFIALRRVREEQ